MEEDNRKKRVYYWDFLNVIGGGEPNAKTHSSKPIENKAMEDESSKHFVDEENDDGNN